MHIFSVLHVHVRVHVGLLNLSINEIYTAVLHSFMKLKKPTASLNFKLCEEEMVNHFPLHVTQYKQQLIHVFIPIK